MRKKRSLWGILIAVGLAFVLVGTVLASMDQKVLEGYIIDLVDVTEDGNQSTWVYAVTAGDTVPDNELSHWSLGIGSCYTIVFPVADSFYTTPINDYGCGSIYTCTQGAYDVVHDAGMTSVVTDGIKFEFDDDSGTLPLGPDNQTTQIFTFTIQKSENQDFRLGETYLDVKPGATVDAGEIEGPVCAPNPVTIASLHAGGRSEYWGIVALVGVVVVGMGWRRHSHVRDR